jgi:hypothetical protein
MKAVLKALQEMNPQAKKNLWNSMTNIQPEYLPHPEA